MLYCRTTCVLTPTHPSLIIFLCSLPPPPCPPGDPETLTTSIGPTSVLSNGTLFVFRDSDVSFNCSTSSGSTRRLAWAFQGASASNGSLVSTVGASLDFRIAAIQPGDQGLYVCRALHGDVAEREVNASVQLLVYCEYQAFGECLRLKKRGKKTKNQTNKAGAGW